MIKSSMNELIAATIQISQGAYLTDIDPSHYNGKNSTMAHAIDQIQKQVVSQLFEMQVVAAQIDASTGAIQDLLKAQKEATYQLIETSADAASMNDQYQAQIQSTVALSTQIMAATNQLEETTTHLSVASKKAQSALSEQLGTITHITDTIRAIQDDTRKTASAVDTLRSDTQKISDILESVKKFYKQTQLLALNASIESARAGEAGKGFGVVATEIGQLASNSASSVGEIGDIMNNIEASLNQVTTEAENTSSKVDEAVKEARIMEVAIDDTRTTFMDLDHQVQDMTKTFVDNKNDLEILSQAIGATFDLSENVSQSLKTLVDQIEDRETQLDEILELEEDLKDTSTSLHVLTEKIDINMLKNKKDAINKQTEDLIEHLGVVIEKNAQLHIDDTTIHANILDMVKEGANQVEAIWSNRKNGSFIYSNPKAGIPNASIRSWFKESMMGKIFVSDVYISAITKTPCITISLPLVEDEEVVGVLGADLAISL